MYKCFIKLYYIFPYSNYLVFAPVRGAFRASPAPFQAGEQEEGGSAQQSPPEDSKS